MERSAPLAVWTLRAAVLAVCAATLAVALSPVGLAPGRLPMPDLAASVLILCLIRRPEAVPLASLIAVSLVSDLLRGAPLGIGTLALLAGAQILLRLREWILRSSFLLEWLLVAVLVVAIALAQSLALWLTFLPAPDPGIMARYVAGTVLSYPLVLLVLRAALPLRPAPRPEAGLP